MYNQFLFYLYGQLCILAAHQYGAPATIWTPIDYMCKNDLHIYICICSLNTSIYKMSINFKAAYACSSVNSASYVTQRDALEIITSDNPSNVYVSDSGFYDLFMSNRGINIDYDMDVDHEVFNTFMRYIYSDLANLKLEQLNFEQLVQLIQLAQRTYRYPTDQQLIHHFILNDRHVMGNTHDRLVNHVGSYLMSKLTVNDSYTLLTYVMNQHYGHAFTFVINYIHKHLTEFKQVMGKRKRVEHDLRKLIDGISNETYRELTLDDIESAINYDMSLTLTTYQGMYYPELNDSKLEHRLKVRALIRRMETYANNF